MSRGSLHPINGKRQQRGWLKTGLVLQRRTGYHPSSREWRPRNYWSLRFGGWKLPSKRSVLDLFGRKTFILLLVSLAITIGFASMYADPANGLFHSYSCIPTPQETNGGLPCGDPSTLIWRATAPEGDLGEFVARTDNCSTACAAYSAGCFVGINCVSLNPTASVTAQVLTKSPIGDIGVAAGKTLAFHVSWTFSGAGGASWSNQNSWGYYLTTNSTVPATANYDPAKDPNVVFQVKVFCTGTCAHGSSSAYRTYVYALRVIGKTDTIDSERLGTNCAGQASGTNGTATSCFDSTFNSVVADNPIAAATYLNFTAATNGNTNCAIVSNVFTGPACSWVFGSQESATVVGIGVQDLPFFSFPAQQYFLGLYASSGNTAATQFTFDTFPNNVKGNLDSFVFVPAPTAAVQPPNIDTGGFFGPIIKALINIGVFVLNAVLGFVAFIVPALEAALNFLVSIIQIALNGIGGAIGFPGTSTNCGTAGGSCALGDLVFLVVGQLTGFVTGLINTLLAEIVPIFTGIANAFTVFVNWIAQAFKFLSDILTFATNVAVFAFGMFTLSLKWVSFGAGLWLFIFFFAFDADDGMRGWIRWFNFSKWLIFDIGVNWTMEGINFLLDVMLFFIGMIPKPFIQMSVGKFPRLPLLEIHGSFDIPEFDGSALKEGNLFSILGFLAGFTGFVFFETTSLPGALGSLPGSVFNAQALANMSVAITFYKLFFPVAVLMIFLLMIPTMFTSIFGVHVAGGGLPISVSRRGRGGPMSSPRSRIGFSKRTTRISRRLEEKGKRVSGEEKAKRLEESLRNRNEEARRQAAKETERVNKEAEQQQLSQQRQVEQAKTSEQRQREQAETEA